MRITNIEHCTLQQCIEYSTKLVEPHFLMSPLPTKGWTPPTGFPVRQSTRWWEGREQHAPIYSQ